MCKIISWIIKGVGIIGECVLVMAIMIIGIVVTVLTSIVEGRNPWYETRDMFKRVGEGIDKMF